MFLSVNLQASWEYPFLPLLANIFYAKPRLRVGGAEAGEELAQKGRVVVQTDDDLARDGTQRRGEHFAHTGVREACAENNMSVVSSSCYTYIPIYQAMDSSTTHHS